MNLNIVEKLIYFSNSTQIVKLMYYIIHYIKWHGGDQSVALLR